MELMIPPGRLDRPVDHETDHVLAVFAASILSAVVGTALLWGASRQELIEEAPHSAGMQIS